MQESEDRLFEAWRAHGDVQALGELFDRVAPKLLRLAVHLAGDATEAEDLVQAVFLAAIEQRSRLAPGLPVMPWLSGVLANKAQGHRRRAARELDPTRLASHEVEDASQPLERRELDGTVARAIDELDEPYRQVVMLRVRHGMAPADIAHVLERDAGTIRVQLHRGLALLRDKLPASLATGLLVGWIAPRGLAAVKTHVLHEAAASIAATASTTTLVGGLLVSKQLIAVALAALALFLFWFTRSAGDRPKEEAALANTSAVAPLDIAIDAVAAPGRSAEVRDEAQRDEIVSDTTPRARLRVVDATTGAALAGVQLAWFRGRKTDVHSLLNDSETYFAMRDDGRLRPRTNGDWPALVGGTDAAFAGRAPLIALDVPSSDEALARATSDRDGFAALAAQIGPGLIEAVLDGYATRRRPVFEGVAPQTIELWPLRTVRGRCIGEHGPINEPLELVIGTTGVIDANAATGTPLDGVGCWRVKTDAKGEFSVAMAGANAFVNVLTPGWDTELMGLDALDDGEISGIVSRTLRWRFVDAQDGAPLERVRLVGRDLRYGWPRWSVELRTRDGYATPPGPRMLWRDRDAGSLSFTAWADGYEATTWTVSERASTKTVEIALQRGATAALRGAVSRNGRPLDGAVVSLFAHSNLNWEAGQVFHTKLVDAAQTSAGRFELRAAAGTYLLQVADGAIKHTRVVEFPATSELHIDLDQLASISVVIVDRTGAPQPDHVLGAMGGDLRSMRARTDADGRAQFDALPAGDYRVFTSHVSTDSSFAGEVLEAVELADGQHADVRLVVMGSSAPRHARVSARDVTDYRGWRARYDDEEWNELSVDGVIPLDLTTSAWRLTINAPDGRTWGCEIPKSEPDGYVIELVGGAARLTGRVLAPNGAPFRGARVRAAPAAACDSTLRSVPECVLDADGHFELTGLAPCNYRLLIYARGEELVGEFEPAAPASADSEPLVIPFVAPRERVKLHGRVRRADGRTAAGATLIFEALTPSEFGTLRIETPNQFAHVDRDGAYQVEMPRTPKLRIRVFVERGAPGHIEELVDDGRPEREFDIDLE